MLCHHSCPIILLERRKDYNGTFIHDVKSMVNEKSRWHPRWHSMLDGG
jgi:hypothetical protein